MKISVISENISRQEFFDFYSLEYAYANHQDPEVERNLDYLAGYILQDHIDQFSNILLDRLPDMDNDDIISLMEQYGITMDDDFYFHGIDKLLLSQKTSLISKLVNIKQHHGFTGDTWFDLGRVFLELVGRVGSSRQSKILAVDKVYNLLHHGGFIVDYMDESNWLEDALHIRDNANPAQLFALSSSRIRALIGRSSYSGMERGKVSDLRKMHSAFRRADEDVSLSLQDDQLTVTVDFTPTIFNGRPGPWNISGTEIPKMYQDLIDKGDLTLDKPLRGTIAIRDIGDQLEVISTNGTVTVDKPINRQYALATDMIQAAMSVAKGAELTKGRSINHIKPSYYRR